MSPEGHLKILQRLLHIRKMGASDESIRISRWWQQSIYCLKHWGDFEQERDLLSHILGKLAPL